MPPFPRVLGWTPPENEDFIDVSLPGQPSAHQKPTFHISDSTPIRLRSHPDNLYHSASPASSTSALSEVHSEKRQDHPKKHGDPSWVARPQNEFILFRCDYVRRHTKECGKRTRRTPGQGIEKTLSKLAAEAWRSLSQEERLHWREQASGERSEHARKHPDYRYRPKKSAESRKRQTRASSTAHNASLAPGVVAPITVGATPCPLTYAYPLRSVERNAYAGESPCKSTSAPFLSNVESKPIQGWMSLSLPSGVESLSSSIGLNDYKNIRPSLQHSPSLDSSGLNTPDLSSTLSISNSATSSLINWNGEPAISSPRPISFASSLSIPTDIPFTSYPTESPLLPPLHKYPDSILNGTSAVNQPLTLQETLHYPNLGDSSSWMSQMPQFFSSTGVLMQTATADVEQSVQGISSMNGLDSAPSPSTSTSSFVYDEAGNVHIMSGGSEYGHGHGEAVCGGEPSVVPLDYLGGSGELSPDEIFIMDHENYFQSF